MMKSFFIAYITAVVAFLIIDGLWLGVIAKSFYAEYMKDFLRKDILVAPAAGFYLLYTAGLVFLAVRPGQLDISLFNVAAYGAIVGFLAYGTYDMTNYATLRDWPLIVSAVDLLWGTLLSAAVATLSRMVLLGTNSQL